MSKKSLLQKMLRVKQLADILGKSVKKQKELAVLFMQLLEIKKELIEPVNLDPGIGGVDHLYNRNAIFMQAEVELRLTQADAFRL